MTDPTGRSFLSYRRACADDAKLLIEAQHDVGIPTWQDTTNLGEEPTQDAIRKVLADPQIANALLWLTPDVDDSPIIQRVEIPPALARFRAGDGFFVTPVLARGLDYKEVDTVLDHRFAPSLTDWNLRKIPSALPLTAQEAAQVAAWVRSLSSSFSRIART